MRDVCPLCSSTQKENLISLPFSHNAVTGYVRSYYNNRADETVLKDWSYSIEQCLQCGGCWQSAILDEKNMELLYGLWIAPEKSRIKRSRPELPVQTARHCARLLRLFPSPQETTLLDFGMGWGNWCHMAQSFGFQVYGAELSQERVEYARSRGIAAYLPQDLPDVKFDFIYLEQVLEHLPMPRKIMQDLTDKLTEGGYIHIGVPNGKKVPAFAGIPERMLRKGPAQPLEHINIFSRSSLVYFMKQFQCHPAHQRELLLRCDSLRHFLSDTCLTIARWIPASVFPPGTSLLFQKKSA